LQEVLDNGKALEKFKEFIAAQGGDSSYVQDTEKFEKAKFVEPITASSSGYIASIEAEQIGYSALVLGGGRETKESVIDLSVGILVEKKIGDYVEKGDTLAVLHGNDKTKMENARKIIESAYVISDTVIHPQPIIKKVIS